MRIMEGFHLRSIAGEMIAVPTGAVATKLSGLAILNETGQFLFELLQSEQTEESLIQAMLDNYEIDRENATSDVLEFISALRENGLLIETGGV